MQLLINKMLRVLCLASFATLAGFNSAVAENSKAQDTAQDATADTDTTKKVPVFFVTHVAMVEETGCWATLYDKSDFEGNQVTLVGKQAEPDIEFDLRPFAIGGEPDSVKVGPNAKLELYGDKNFKDKEASLTAQSAVADLNTEPFWDDIDSVKLICDDMQVSANVQ